MSQPSASTDIASRLRLLRVGAPGKERPAALIDDEVVDLSEHVEDIDGPFLAADGIGVCASIIAQRGATLRRLDHDLRFGPPVARIGKIVCVGLNYRRHAEEAGQPVPDEPILFLKAASTVVGANDTVLIPHRSTKTDWEVELAVVIGRRARYIGDESVALSHVAGYAISNDISEREFQLERGGQWDKGKNCETFNPLGPVLTPTAAIGDVQALGLELSVNGDVMQRSNTADMIFSIKYLVWYVSQFMVLEPGDVINTGTPEGVGLGMTPPRFLSAGDIVEASISGLGTQRQRFEQAEP